MLSARLRGYSRHIYHQLPLKWATFHWMAPIIIGRAYKRRTSGGLSYLESLTRFSPPLLKDSRDAAWDVFRQKHITGPTPLTWPLDSLKEQKLNYPSHPVHPSKTRCMKHSNLSHTHRKYDFIPLTSSHSSPSRYILWVSPLSCSLAENPTMIYQSAADANSPGVACKKASKSTSCVSVP